MKLCFLFICLLIPSQVFPGALFWEMTKMENQKVLRKWSHPHIRWRYNPSNAPANIESIIRQAFQAWETQTSAPISDEFMGVTNNTTPQPDGYSNFLFDVDFSSIGVPSTVIAVTLLNSTNGRPNSIGDAAITKADILINPKMISQLSTEPSNDPSQLDLVEILTHEIGHAYGLAHSLLIDSMMYPAEPRSSDPPSLKALYRAPKRTLAQDDIAWMNQLYPSLHFEELTGQIGGQVLMDGQPFVGAHVIAIKADESSFSMNFSGSDLIVKGLQNVSAFSEEHGYFTIKGLKPGRYNIIAQNSSDFLNIGLANVNSYLGQFATRSNFPLEFWSNPDCSATQSVSSSNLTDAFNASTSFPVLANFGFCEIGIVAHNGGASCGSEPSYFSRCSSSYGGGCNLQERNSSPQTLILLILLSLFIFGIRFHLVDRDIDQS